MSLTRRSFLEAAACLPLLGAMPAARYQLGYATITWGARLEQAFDDISAAGYTGIQFRSPEFDTYKDRPEAFQQMLAARKLVCVAMSSGTVDLDAAKRQAYIDRSVEHAKFLKKIGAPYMQLLDGVKPGPNPEAGVHKQLAGLLNEIGARVSDEGVKLGYHNHMNSLSEKPDDCRRLLDLLDPAKTRLILDTGHLKQGGSDPVKIFADYGGHLLFPHFKDHYAGPPAKVGDGQRQRDVWFSELGLGDVDFPGVLAQMSKHGYQGWIVVELDVYIKTRTERESAELSMKYLREKL
jgi:inosose dehydratase